MSKRIKELIAIWKPRLEASQPAHYAEARRLSRWHYGIGVFTTVLTAVAGATLLTEADDPTIRTAVGVIGLLAAVLSAVQTFYSHGKRAEMHRATSAQLAALRNRMEVAEIYPPKDEGAEDELVIHFQKELERLGLEAPVVGAGPDVQPEYV